MGTVAIIEPEWRNGRRGGLKIPCPKGRVGSTPSSGILRKGNEIVSYRVHAVRHIRIANEPEENRIRRCNFDAIIEHIDGTRLLTWAPSTPRMPWICPVQAPSVAWQTAMVNAQGGCPTAAAYWILEAWKVGVDKIL